MSPVARLLASTVVPPSVSVKPYGRSPLGYCVGYQVKVDGRIAARFDIADHSDCPLIAVCAAFDYAERRRSRPD